MIQLTGRCRLDPRFPLAKRELLGLLERILPVLGLKGACLGLRLVGDREMAGLNERFLGCAGPTNVLSFPAGSERSGRARDLGELALNVDALGREARLYGQPPVEHLARLLAHGLLHLAGLSHGPIMDALAQRAVDAVRAWPA
ncbi:MAG: rRNA maturation RNase YbeY [Desulfovibrionaceae bacterium]|nr:rRNA maturation RNase YbeY [Desulfovibrionaceae bacterium]MDD4951708.1 rRNA maturation RNase YbeY [Desulfovibrionaceae bacterium]